MKKSLTRRYLPMASPSGTPIAIAIMKPIRMRRTLMAILYRYLFDSPTCVSCW